MMLIVSEAQLAEWYELWDQGVGKQSLSVCQTKQRTVYISSNISNTSDTTKDRPHDENNKVKHKAKVNIWEHKARVNS